MTPESHDSQSTMNGNTEYHDQHYFFLNPQAARELPRYQYQGEDRSLLYRYVLSPLASFCVYRLTPKSMAPNTITLFGIVLMLLSYIFMWYYVPNLIPGRVEPPRWIFLFNGIATFIYQTLDNMDGKQARRTGSSSPLGLLFDHGCDAINSLFGSANWMIAMMLHPANDVWLCWSILFGPYGLFYIGTWEEYYTQKLIMPIVNGPSEGLLGAVIMSLLSWWYGPMFWQTTIWWDAYLLPMTSRILPSNMIPIKGLRNADLLVLASSIGFVQEIALKIVFVARTYGLRTLWNLLPFATLVVCSLVVGYIDLDIWLDMPRTSLHLCAFLFVDMTVDLMLTHMTKQVYQCFRWTLLPLVAFIIVVATGYWKSGPETAEFLTIYTTAMGTFLMFKLTLIIHEMATVLNIWCFDITTKRIPYAHLKTK